jgi:hypothetical protein
MVAIISNLKKSYEALNSSIKKYKEKLSPEVTHISQFFFLQGLYQSLALIHKEPTIIIGLAPLYGVQSYEISRSYDTLKYRAVRGIFMAHQKGGNLAMKIDLLLYGQDQFVIYNVLKGLQIYGEGDPIERAGFNPKSPSLLQNQIMGTNTKPSNAGLKLGDKLPSTNKTLTASSDYEPGDMSYLDQKIRKTFTIFTLDEILFNMYIETISISRSVKDGIKVLSVSIMCRQFNEPTTIELDSYRITGNLQLTKNDKGKYEPTIVEKLVKTVKYSKRRDVNLVDLRLNAAHAGFMTYSRFSYNREYMRSSTFRGIGIYTLNYLQTSENVKTKSLENISSSLKSYSSNPKETAFVEFTLPSPPIVQTNRKLYYDQDKNRTDHIIFYVNNGAPQILWNYYPITDDTHFNQVAQNIANNSNITLNYETFIPMFIKLVWKDKVLTIFDDNNNQTNITLNNTNYILYDRIPTTRGIYLINLIFQLNGSSLNIFQVVKW